MATAHRTLTHSPYLVWAKLSSQARFNLATSGVAAYPLAKLPVRLEELEISGPGGTYGFPPLQQRLGQTSGRFGRVCGGGDRHVDGELPGLRRNARSRRRSSRGKSCVWAYVRSATIPRRNRAAFRKAFRKQFRARSFGSSTSRDAAHAGDRADKSTQSERRFRHNRNTESGRRHCRENWREGA